MTKRKPTEADSHLSVHVLGSGLGESIILQWPHESMQGRFRWGLIDCYCASTDPEDNRSLRFLRSHQDLGALCLDFVCLTHPHEDHFYGLWHLFDALDVRVEKFWRCDADEPKLLRVFASAANENDATSLDIARLEDEWTRLLRKTTEHRSDPNRYSRLADYKPRIHSCEIPWIDRGQSVPVVISSLSPSSVLRDRHTELLSRCVHANSANGDWQFSPDSYDRKIHNLLSVVLAVSFGQTRIILGADAERTAWEHILADDRRKQDNCELACQVLKVSHHGSENAFVEAAWEEHSKGKLWTSVVTPYERGRTQLPKDHMLKVFGQYADKVHVTSRSQKRPTHSVRFESSILTRRARHIAGPTLPIAGKTVTVDHRGNVVGISDLELT